MPPSNRIRLNRCLGPVTALQPGEYTIETMSGLPALSCPGCGGLSDLPDTHRIIGNRVVPIWSCPTESCPLIEWLELGDWGE